MRKFIVQAILLLLVAAGAIFLFRSPTAINLPFVPEKTMVRKIEINNAKITAEVADTQAKRKKGLGGRETLASDEGMLFVFEDKGKHSFWMKGLTFPLDFIWIEGNKVAGVLENVPPPARGQTDESLPIYQSQEDIDKVLEVRAGTVGKFNIKAGDPVKIE